MLCCQKLSVDYKETRGITEVDLTISQGDKLVVLGPSGCGKSTLIKAMAGLLRSTNGQVLFENQVVDSMMDHTAICFQDKGLFPWMTVYDNVTLPLQGRGIKSQMIGDRATEILNRFELEAYSDRFPGTLSSGQQQRVAIARAIIQAPKILYLDEPSTGLDMVAREGLQSFLMSLGSQYDLTMVVVTHDLEEAAFLGDRIVVMEEGRITESLANPVSKEERQLRNKAYYDFCIRLRQVMGE